MSTVQDSSEEVQELGWANSRSRQKTILLNCAWRSRWQTTRAGDQVWRSSWPVWDWNNVCDWLSHTAQVAAPYDLILTVPQSSQSVELEAVLPELVLLHALLQDSRLTRSSRNVNKHLHISRRCNGLRIRGGFSRVTDPRPQITSCNLISHLKHSDICAVCLPS